MKEDIEGTQGSWAKLTERHRVATAQQPVEAPFGFALRVAARWREDRSREIAAAWERMSFRAAFASSLVALVVAGLAGFWEQAMAADEELIPVLETRADETEWLLP
jgi:hypothetical protein